MPADRLETIVSLSKRRGIVFPSSEIYGGLRASWDYGPLGVELKNNVKRQWWKAMVQGRDDVVGLDSSVILAREVWEASGHVETFSDPLTECQSCHRRFRADHLLEAYAEKHGGGRAGAVGADLPELRQPRHLHRSAQLLGAAQDLPRPGGRRVRAGLPAAGDRAGHLHQLRARAAGCSAQAAVRHRPDRQVLPQRDHARQLHLPYPRIRADGDGVLLRARYGRGVASVLDRLPDGVVHRAGHQAPENLRLFDHPPRSARTIRSGPSTSNTGTVSPAPSGASWRASPTAPTSTSPRTARHPAPTSPISTRPAAPAGRRTWSSPRSGSTARCWCSCSMPTARTRRPTPRA